MPNWNDDFSRKMLLPLLFLISVCSFFADFMVIYQVKLPVFISGITLITGSATHAPSIWFILVLTSGLFGFLYAIISVRLKHGIQFLLALAGIVFLLMGQFELVNAFQEHTVKVNFQWGYWLCLMALALAGSCAYLKQSKGLKQSHITPPSNAVNINIITSVETKNKPKS